MKPQIAREHEFEAQYGLPEKLPEGERILWQGAPDWQVIARRVFHVNKVAIYFALMLHSLAFCKHLVRHAKHLRRVRVSGLAFSCAGSGAAGCDGLVDRAQHGLHADQQAHRHAHRHRATVAYDLPLKRIESADLHDAGTAARTSR